MATSQRFTRADLGAWVKKNTYLNGKRFSTVGHEYQDRIMSDLSQEIVIKKSAQIGISECSLRLTLGLVSIMPHFSAIYSMPTATLAGTYTKARLDPIIQGSPFLREAIRGEMDSAGAKQLGPNNFMYMTGASTGGQAISVTADLIVNDEVSFSDPTVLEMLNSRLIHSKHKLRLSLSTPTYNNDPIDKAFKGSRRFFNFVKCHHCSHSFLPDYYEHVKIPGYAGPLQAIRKDILASIRYKEAELLCPSCGKAPSLLPMHREWVCENPGQDFIAAGYSISPFDCPTFISAPSLVAASTKYESLAQFTNFHLGQCAEDSESGLTPQDIDAMGVTMVSSPFTTHQMGADMGLRCHALIGGLDDKERLIVTHTEHIPVGDFRKRYHELCAQHRLTAKVLDAQPYVETVMHLQDTDANLFAGLFIKKRGLEIYDVVSREENIEEGKMAIRQISINRNKALDLLMDEIRLGNVLVRKDKNWDEFKKQMCSLRRVKQVTENGIEYVWSKSDGADHSHFALLFLLLATKLRGAIRGSMSTGLPGVMTFKLTGPPPKRA